MLVLLLLNNWMLRNLCVPFEILETYGLIDVIKSDD